MRLFTGNAYPELAHRVAEELGITLGKVQVGRFSDGEIMVEILENVRGQEVFILQSASAPCNDNLMELMIMADALRRASASTIIAVMPYFSYARQDRRVRSARVPISAKVVADMLTSVGIRRVVTVDLHADQIQGFFHNPVDNVYASPLVIADVKRLEIENPIVVSPDVGGVMRARAIAKRLNDADLSIIDKRRVKVNQTEVMNIIGDVNGRHCLLVDDIIDTAGTLTRAAEALKKNGAKSIIAYCTHPILSGRALVTIEESMLDELIVCDSIPLSTNSQNCSKIRQISLSGLLAETIYRVSKKKSLRSMFNEPGDGQPNN